MADTPRLSIIVISYNTREMTLECLRSVVRETRPPYELLVVDNDSADGSAEAIAAEFPDIRLFAERTNHGFAGANNLATAEARGDYLLLLNPDTVVQDGANDKLLDFALRTPEARIWGGRTLFGDGSLNPGSCWGRLTLWNIFARVSGLTRIFPHSPLINQEDYGGWQRDNEAEVDIVTGCFFLIARTDWHALGGFDPLFHMYGEEADLCLRARRELGARPRITPEATIIHYGGASEAVRSDKMVRLLAAKMTLIERHLPTWQRGAARRLYRLWPLTRRIALGIAGRRERAAVWGEIWDRRAEWEHGFE